MKKVDTSDSQDYFKKYWIESRKPQIILLTKICMTLEIIYFIFYINSTKDIDYARISFHICLICYFMISFKWINYEIFILNIGFISL